MEDKEKQDVAVQIAIETLKERCRQFEQRVMDVESENARLKSMCGSMEDSKQDSLNEIDTLKQKISQLRSHNTQLKNNIQMVATENRQLWTRLTKLSEVNQNLGSKLSKINDSIMQHSTNVVDSPSTTLIRSKTFTQNDPYKKYQQKNILDESTRISLELEDVSLKLISSLAKETSELEAQCNEMNELQSRDIDKTCGFSYPGDDLDESVIENFEKHIKDLKLIKENVLHEKQFLLENINIIDSITVQDKCKTCSERQNDVDEKISKQLTELDMSTTEKENGTSKENAKETMPLEDESLRNMENNGLMCPFCSKIFPSQAKLFELQVHVERHFTAADNNFVLL